jgi:hypothetical protein
VGRSPISGGYRTSFTSLQILSIAAFAFPFIAIHDQLAAQEDLFGVAFNSQPS